MSYIYFKFGLRISCTIRFYIRICKNIRWGVYGRQGDEITMNNLQRIGFAFVTPYLSHGLFAKKYTTTTTVLRQADLHYILHTFFNSWIRVCYSYLELLVKLSAKNSNSIIYDDKLATDTSEEKTAHTLHDDTKYPRNAGAQLSCTQLSSDVYTPCPR